MKTSEKVGKFWYYGKRDLGSFGTVICVTWEVLVQRVSINPAGCHVTGKYWTRSGKFWYYGKRDLGSFGTAGCQLTQRRVT